MNREGDKIVFALAQTEANGFHYVINDGLKFCVSVLVCKYVLIKICWRQVLNKTWRLHILFRKASILTSIFKVQRCCSHSSRHEWMGKDIISCLYLYSQHIQQPTFSISHRVLCWTAFWTLGLAQLSNACQCSYSFICNIFSINDLKSLGKTIPKITVLTISGKMW